jgi:ABC-type multidrug transport system fused ATPase/permease subunit
LVDQIFAITYNNKMANKGIRGDNVNKRRYETKQQNITLLAPVKKYWYMPVIYLVLSFVLTQVVVDGSNRIAVATDQLFAGNTVKLSTLIAPFLILTLIGTGVAFVKTLIKQRFSVNVQTEFKNITVHKLVRLQYSYFDEAGSGSIMNKMISDIYQLEELFTETIPEFLLCIVTIITVGVYIFQSDYRLFFVTIICYPLLLFIANVISKKLGKLSGNRRALYDELEETALDNYNGMIVGITFNLYAELKKRTEKVIHAILKNEYTRTRISSISLTLGNVIRWIPTILCYLFALYEVFHGYLTVGLLLSFTMLLDRIVHPFSQLPNFINSIRELKVSYDRLNAIVKQPDEVSGNESFSLSDSKDENVITLNDITFSYDGERTIFHHLNLAVAKGKKTAFVGSSGGGKSTVFKILCGFYLPQEGTYSLYGHPFEAWDVKVLRQQYALVSQNVFLFPVSIEENVAYGRMGATHEEVVNACKQANIHDFIMDLPEQYETVVGERGTRLSGGQRQRISIARAFLKNAPILLLDEPTSAVDVETEELIKEALKKISENRTVLTIAHRLSTIEDSDEILVFDQGHVVETGSHNELLHKQGVYYNLYMKENQTNTGFQSEEA